jgi:hypothetical protein
MQKYIVLHLNVDITNISSMDQRISNDVGSVQIKSEGITLRRIQTNNQLRYEINQYKQMDKGQDYRNRAFEMSVIPSASTLFSIVSVFFPLFFIFSFNLANGWFSLT